MNFTAGRRVSKTVTSLVVELPEHAQELGREVVPCTVANRGGSLIVDRQSNDNGCVEAAAEFPLAATATLAAVDIVGSFAAVDPALSVRVALRTGPSGDDGRPSDVRLAQAAALLTDAGDGEIIVDATTAVMVDAALPAGVELVVRGNGAPRSSRPADPTYELRRIGAEAHAEAVRHHDGHRPPVLRSNLGWARRAAPTALVGREDASARLGTAWQATLHGYRHNVVIAGEGGIGKTALAGEFALRAHSQGALVMYGRWDREQAMPFQAFREALGNYVSACSIARLREEIDEYRSQIRQILPEIGGVRIGDGHLTGDSDLSDLHDERLALHVAVRAWLDLIAARSPVLLVLDDLQWAETPSLLLLDDLWHSTSRAPWALFATARRGETDGTAIPDILTQAQTGDDEVQYIELGGLSGSAMSPLVQQMTNYSLQPGHEALEWLTDATAGNPLLAKSLLRCIGNAADVPAELLAARNGLPGPVKDVIRWRLRHLPLPTRHLLRHAAVGGPAVDLPRLATATSTAPVVVRRWLEPALREEVLRFDPEHEWYTFPHEIVRRALCQDDGLDVEAVPLDQLQSMATLEPSARRSG